MGRVTGLVPPLQHKVLQYNLNDHRDAPTRATEKPQLLDYSMMDISNNKTNEKIWTRIDRKIGKFQASLKEKSVCLWNCNGDDNDVHHNHQSWRPSMENYGLRIVILENYPSTNTNLLPSNFSSFSKWWLLFQKVVQLKNDLKKHHFLHKTTVLKA